MYCFINGKQTTLSDHMTDDLARSVIISLFSWERAGKDDELPGISREGWWADTYADKDPIGSKLWLLSREKLTSEVLRRAKTYAEDALKWMIDDRVASRVEVTVERRDDGAGMNMSVIVVKPSCEELSMRFMDVWSNR